MLKKLHYVHHGRILLSKSVLILASLGEGDGRDRAVVIYLHRNSRLNQLDLCFRY
jgi:hypothetical protein